MGTNEGKSQSQLILLNAWHICQKPREIKETKGNFKYNLIPHSKKEDQDVKDSLVETELGFERVIGLISMNKTEKRE